jgi:hypothetical protein
VTDWLSTALAWLSDHQNLAALGTFLGGLGTCGIAGAGFYGLNKYIQEKRIDRKMALAEEAIYVFHELRNDIRQIRHWEPSSDERKALEEREDINEPVDNMQKYGLVTLMRIDKRSDSLWKMNRLEPKFKAFFGETDAFQKMVNVRHLVLCGARMLAGGCEDRKVAQDCEDRIWSRENDALNREMDEAVAEIEHICAPVLRGRGA